MLGQSFVKWYHTAPHSQSSTNTGIWKGKTQAGAVLVGLGLLVADTSLSVQGCFVFSGMIFYIKMQSHPSATQLFRYSALNNQRAYLIPTNLMKHKKKVPQKKQFSIPGSQITELDIILDVFGR